MRGVGGIRRWLALAAGVMVTASGLSAAGWVAIPDVAGALTSTTPDSMWVANGRVQAIDQVGDRIYLGGQFNMVGPPVGHLAMTDRATGAVIGSPFEVTGTVARSFPTAPAAGTSAARSRRSTASLAATRRESRRTARCSSGTPI